MSSFQGVLIGGVPAVLFIEVSSFQGVLIRGVPAVLFIEGSSFQGVLIRDKEEVQTYTNCFKNGGSPRRMGPTFTGGRNTEIGSIRGS